MAPPQDSPPRGVPAGSRAVYWRRAPPTHDGPPLHSALFIHTPAPPPLTDYPEKTCELDRLVTHKRLVESALAGKKTQQRRNGVYGYPGESFELEDQSFEITKLFRQTLGEMSEADAHSEGYADLGMYKDLILRMHKGMEWDESDKVWVHEFRLVKASDSAD